MHHSSSIGGSIGGVRSLERYDDVLDEDLFDFESLFSGAEEFGSDIDLLSDILLDVDKPPVSLVKSVTRKA